MKRTRNYPKDINNEEFVYEYITKMRIENKENFRPTKSTESYPSLEDIIEKDQKLEETKRLQKIGA